MPDTLIDIVIHLPGASDVKLKGRVRHSVKTPVVSIKNGMGVEILENDPQYISFVRSVVPHAGKEPDSGGPTPGTLFQRHIHESAPDGPLQPEFSIIACLKCGARNKVDKAKLSLGPKCGKCGHPLTSPA